jgi:hypothetical protein
MRPEASTPAKAPQHKPVPDFAESPNNYGKTSVFAGAPHAIFVSILGFPTPACISLQIQ